MPPLQPEGLILRENMYGHLGRLEFLEHHIAQDASILEFGCGTGCMITLPLLDAGYDAYGIDLDRNSIEYGQRVLLENGFDPSRIQVADIGRIDRLYDVIIASEVLEHIPDGELGEVLGALYSRLHDGGRLLVTVPNGFGWFELESFLWFKLGIGRMLEFTRITEAWFKIKYALIGVYVDSSYLSSLSDSPHVQRFSRRGITRLLQCYGFDLLASTGTALVSGPFSNWLFTGFHRIMTANRWLRRRFPKIASGFLLAAEKPASAL